SSTACRCSASSLPRSPPAPFRWRSAGWHSPWRSAGRRNAARRSSLRSRLRETEMNDLTRRDFTALAAGLGAASLLPSLAAGQTAAAPLVTKAIPSTGERVPAVGLGTASVFDVGPDPARRAALAQVVRNLVEGGGSIIDTASSYGSAEGVVGDLVAAAGLRRKVFIATKLEAPDAAELRRSLQRLHTEQVDLLQLHNVGDPKEALGQFREWKAKGVCRYV